MQGAGEDVVERMQVPRPDQRLPVEQPRKLLQLGQRLGNHAGEEHPRVHQAIEAPPDGVAAGGQVERRTHRRHRPGLAGGRAAVFGRPPHEGVATQRDAHRDQRTPGVALLHARQHPVDFFMVARVVGPRRQVQLTGTAPEMRHRHGHAVLLRPRSKGLDVGAVGRALEAMKHHQQRCAIGRGVRGMVHVHEVAIRGVPPLAAEPWRRPVVRSCEQRRPQGLGIAAGQPPGRLVIPFAGHQWRMGRLGAISGISARDPGLAWCATMRQPRAVLM